MRIVTDSRPPGEPKDAESSHLYTLYRAFAKPEESTQFRQALEDGLGWGEAKEQLFALIENEIGPMRAKYDELMARPDRIEEILQAGALKARKLATPFMQSLREAVGLRHSTTVAISAAPAKAQGGKKARFVSFRDEDGRFRFRLQTAAGDEVFLSEAFDSPQHAGKIIKQLQHDLPDEALRHQDGMLSVTLDNVLVCRVPEAALADLRAALAQLQDK